MCSKVELKEKLRKADVYFTRMKRCRGSKDADFILSTPPRESITSSKKHHLDFIALQSLYLLEYSSLLNGQGV